MRVHAPKVERRHPKYIWLLKMFFPLIDLKTVVVSYGDTIYAQQDLSPGMWVHEEMHLQQHRYSKFWAFIYTIRYITSPAFRYRSELEAFRAQYKHAKDFYSEQKAHEVLQWCAAMLSHPAYGSLVPRARARHDIQEGLKENPSKWSGPVKNNSLEQILIDKNDQYMATGTTHRDPTKLVSTQRTETKEEKVRAIVREALLAGEDTTRCHWEMPNIKYNEQERMFGIRVRPGDMFKLVGERGEYQ